MLKDVLPKFFKRLGLSKESVIWYAGLHTSTDNRHCHIIFFEKEPSFYNIRQGKYCYRRGRVQGETLRLLKSDIETHLLKEKGEAKEIRGTLLKEIKQGKIETALSSTDPILKADLREVLERIPYKGRKSYASLNKETKRHLDNLSSIILSSSSEGREMLSSLARLRKKEEKTRERYQASKKGLQADLLERDLYRRVGNHLIDTLIQKRDEAFKEYDFLSRPDIQRRQLHAISTMLNHMIQDMKERQYYEDLWWKELLKRVKKEMEQEKGETEKE